MIPDALKKRILLASAAGAVAVAATLGTWFEGREYTPYADAGGTLTVCDGHTGPGIDVAKVYTDPECDALAADDRAAAASAVDRLVKVPITEFQRAALIDFAFNDGPTALAGSTLLKKLNAGDTAGACAEYDRWVNAKVNGKLTPLPGLVKRADAREWLCLQP